MKRYFTNGNGTNRSIAIKVDTETITFYFDSDITRFNEMKEDEMLQDDDIQEEPTYFYWIGVEDFKKDKEHWINHMMRKNWFTQEMLQYINNNI